MVVKAMEVFHVIERLGDHYRNNINNRFLRKALLNLTLDKAAWDSIETLTNISDHTKQQGLRLEELYDAILALANFVFRVRLDILPNLRFLASEGSDSIFSRSAVSGSSDRILKDMAISNFSVNIRLLADMVNELYVAVVEQDKALHQNSSPVFMSNPELKHLGQLLVE